MMRKKATVRVFSLLLCGLLLLSAFTGTARAADLSKQNCEFECLRHCNIMTLKTNQYTEGRPVIIFFPGKLECSKIVNTANWIRKYQLYDHLNADVIAAAFRSDPLKPQDWKGPAEDLLNYLLEKHEASPFTVAVDAVSASGYGGCYLAQLFNENGITVTELSLADAVIPNYVTAEWITQIAAMGTRVSLWGCQAKGNMSEEARRLIAELDGTENVRGVVLDTPHGQVLHDAIYEYGLHAEFSE